MYTKKYQVHTYEVDNDNTLTITALFHYLQDVMIENANSYGASTRFHHEKGLAWVLIDYDIDLYDMPTVFEDVTCGTLPYSFKKYYGYRKYEAKIQDQLVAKGTGRFVLMNMNDKTLAMPTKELLSLFTDALEKPASLPLSKHRLLDIEPHHISSIEVKKSDIDLNNHMNNVKYLEHALDSLNNLNIDLGSVSNIRITYKKECYLGDQLTLKAIKTKKQVQVQIYKGNDHISLITLTL